MHPLFLDAAGQWLFCTRPWMTYSFSEEDLERYVRFPETLTPEMRQVIESQLEIDPEMKRVVSFYRAFYEELDALSREVSPEMQTLLDRLFPGAESGEGESE